MKDLKEIIINETGEKILIPEYKFSSYGNDKYKFVNVNNHLYHRVERNQNYYTLLVKDMYKIEIKK